MLSAPGHQLIHERCDESKTGFQRGSREAQVRFSEYQEGTEKLLRWMSFRWGGWMIRWVRVGEFEEMTF